MWGALPWILATPLAALIFRPPARLARAVAEGARPQPAPMVSIVVPARNEAPNIARCVGSLTRQTYPRFEIIVVDDRSEDGTAGIAAAVPLGAAKRIQVIGGQPLPPGWFGKPWACTQGAASARGDVLLFTDADTEHAPELLGRAVTALLGSEADLLSLVGVQVMGSFWEGVVQPQVFMLLASRYPDSGTLFDPYLDDPRKWREAIANGQYMMMHRESYDRLGGHEVVRGDVVEDLRLAQELVRRGGRLAIRDALGSLRTRMYRSLSGIVEGWSKNIWTASRLVYAERTGRVVFAVAVALLVLLWIVPPLVLALGALGIVSAGWTAWAAAATAGSVLFWALATWRIGGSPLYALGYPFGTAAVVHILLRSRRRGDTITWKGRVYGPDAGGPE